MKEFFSQRISTVFLFMGLLCILNIYATDDGKEFKPLRILYSVAGFPVLSETFIVDQITGLLDRGHDVYIHATVKGDMSKVHNKIREYNLFKRVFYGKNPPNVSGYDIVFCSFGPFALPFLSLKKKYPFKLITCFRGFDLSSTIKKNPRIYDELFISGDLFLPVCDYYRNRLIKLGCSPEKILIHYDTIDVNKFSFKQRSLDPTDKIKIVTVGRLVEKKGYEYSIRAVAQLLQKYPNIEYTIIGYGELEGALQNLIKKLGVQNKMKLLGRRTQEEVINILDESDIFLFAATTAKDGNQETITQTLKEAMAMGIPVVSTYHSGIPELVTDGQTGFLVPEKDVDGLAQKIEHLITHPEIWPSLTQAARKVVEERFDINKANDRLVDILEVLVKK